jgi:3'-phosphoadenosine 5'-phosphosulfate (PAPS) 3'-phosphatase
MDNLLKAARPKNIHKVAGSGNKFIHLAEERSDYYLNLIPGFKYWDMCASEALISSRFGIVSDAKKRPQSYDN